MRIGSRSKLDEKHKTIRTKTQRSAVEKSLALAFTATDTADPDNGDRDASG
ncbi:MAG: hypothetical protein M3324_04340 [Actinomycetota bacterium]|nr:hypothetical protein [Actinomycetota bacterium]